MQPMQARVSTAIYEGACKDVSVCFIVMQMKVIMLFAFQTRRRFLHENFEIGSGSTLDKYKL